MKPRTTIRKALSDKRLLGHVIAGNSWKVWRTLLIAAMGEKLLPDERTLFTQITGREREPLQRVHEFEVVGGRRSGKTRALSCLISYISGLCDHRDVLIGGETGVFLALAQTQQVATQLLNYVEEDFNSSPLLKQLVVGRTADTLELKGNISVEVRPASLRKLRGPTYIGICADELAFWMVGDNYQNPDVEILAAASPGLLTTRGPIVMASSPYSRKGVLWDTYRKHYGPNGSPLVLVAHGSTRTFNNTVPQDEIDRLLEKDPARNAAEYLAEWRTDIESFVSADVVEACVVRDRRELQPQAGVAYCAFIDPAGGSGGNSMTLAIAHRGIDGRVILDAVRERRPPFSPENCVAEFGGLLKTFHVGLVVGDRWGGEFVREPFRQFGIRYELSEKVKSDIYRDSLPLLNSERVELLDLPRLIGQLCSLERRVGRNGHDVIDHVPGGRDDISNAAMGALLLAGAAQSVVVSNDLLRRIQALPKRREHVSARSQMLFGISNEPPADRQGYGAYHLQHLARERNG